MVKKATGNFNENTLGKGQLRKLNALRKSLGTDIANKAFGEWIKKQAKLSKSTPTDVNAKAIGDAIEPLAKQGKLRIPRGGYIIRRGRGRVIVERVRQ